MHQSQKSTLRSRQLVWAAAAVLILLFIGSGIAIWLLRQGALADAEADSHRLGVVLAEQTNRTVQAVDFVLQETLHGIIDSGVHDLASLHEKFDTSAVHDGLTRRLIDLPQVNLFIVVDSAGRLVNITGKPPGSDWSVADRPYFTHFAANPDAGPYISEPSVGRASGLRTFFLVRRITARDGGFLGVLVASLSLDYFDRLFASTGFSDGTGVTILRRDGLMLVHFPGPPVPAGQRLPADSGWYQTVAAGGGRYISPGVLTAGSPSLVSVHPLLTYPLVVDLTRNQVAALSRWWHQAIVLALGVLAATVSLTFLLRALVRQIAISDASQEQIRQQVIALQASRMQVATTLDHMNQGLIMVAGNGNIALYNQRAIDMLDLPAEMMATYPRWADVIDFQVKNGEFAKSGQSAVDAPHDFNASYEVHRPDGTVVEVRAAPLPEGGQVRTYTDITARAAAEEMLGLAASHDHLTGLANRNGFNSRLDTALTAAQRGQIKLAVLCLDLDRFKMVNDTLGHGVGDQLLIQVAQRMREIARKSDVIGRLGGDEFAIVVADCDHAGAQNLAERLLEAVRTPYTLGKETAKIGVSIGIAVYPADGSLTEDLLRNADTALYKAKAAGRNTCCIYASEDGDRESRRLSLEQDIRTAVEMQHFTLAYQPICDSATSLPVAFEALLRWNHPTRGDVSPAEFIPIAEQTGLIIPLGRWVIKVACAEAAAWAVPLRIAVNLSPTQFCDHNLLDFIKQVLTLYRPFAGSARP